MKSRNNLKKIFNVCVLIEWGILSSYEKKILISICLRMKCQFSVDSIAVVEDLNIMH